MSSARRRLRSAAVQSHSLRNRTVPSATCASADALSIASARNAEAFASANASWCGTARSAACSAACARQSRVRRRVGRIDLDRGAKRVHRIRQLEVRARQQVRAPASDELVELDRAGLCTLGAGGSSSAAIAGDRRDEAISRPRHRLDVGRRPRVVAKRLAQRRDVDGEDPFLDEGLRPDVRRSSSFVTR